MENILSSSFGSSIFLVCVSAESEPIFFHLGHRNAKHTNSGYVATFSLNAEVVGVKHVHKSLLVSFIRVLKEDFDEKSQFSMIVRAQGDVCFIFSPRCLGTTVGRVCRFACPVQYLDLSEWCKSFTYNNLWPTRKTLSSTRTSSTCHSNELLTIE